MKTLLITLLSITLINCGAGTNTPTGVNDTPPRQAPRNEDLPPTSPISLQDTESMPTFKINVSFIKDGVPGNFVIEGSTEEEINTKLDDQLAAKNLNENNYIVMTEAQECQKVEM